MCVIFEKSMYSLLGVSIVPQMSCMLCVSDCRRRDEQRWLPLFTWRTCKYQHVYVFMFYLHLFPIELFDI